jgi:ergothioneine biosynthesis protein EgtB
MIRVGRDHMSSQAQAGGPKGNPEGSPEEKPETAPTHQATPLNRRQAKADQPLSIVPPPAVLTDRPGHLAYYHWVRAGSQAFAAMLEPEDMAIQSMPDASPTKWHLAHTSWFFETFLLLPHLPNYTPYDENFSVLFNSYYQQIGPQWARAQRGQLSRPTVSQVLAYRAHVNAAMEKLIANASHATWEEIRILIILGLNHEQQHQELMATDLKHMLAQNPLSPAPFERPFQHTPQNVSPLSPLSWSGFEGGIVPQGRNLDPSTFAFDNEGPGHDVLLQPYLLANRLVTNGEYLAFIQDAGYARSELWLSDGWAEVQTHQWAHPLYWRPQEDGSYVEYTLAGAQALDLTQPITHLSAYEAAAYAQWAGARLPREAELEHATKGQALTGNFYAPGAIAPHPQRAQRDEAPLQQLFGDCWEWTQSAYSAYPGYRAPAGAVGEYNGKFMILRGGSCATPHGHMRATYRNFFPAGTRWQFSGLRLALDTPT